MAFRGRRLWAASVSQGGMGALWVGGFCSFANAMTFSAFCTRNRSTLGSPGWMPSPYRAANEVNLFIDGGSGGRERRRLRRKGPCCVAMANDWGRNVYICVHLQHDCFLQTQEAQGLENRPLFVESYGVLVSSWPEGAGIESINVFVTKPLGIEHLT